MRLRPPLYDLSGGSGNHGSPEIIPIFRCTSQAQILLPRKAELTGVAGHLMQLIRTVIGDEPSETDPPHAQFATTVARPGASVCCAAARRRFGRPGPYITPRIARYFIPH